MADGVAGGVEEIEGAVGEEVVGAEGAGAQGGGEGDFAEGAVAELVLVFDVGVTLSRGGLNVK